MEAPRSATLAPKRATVSKLAATKLRRHDGLTVSDGTITAPGGTRKSRIEGIGAEAELHREASAGVPPKPPKQHQFIGKSKPRLDIPAKVTGGAAYVQDIRLPGMLHGRISRPPDYRAELVAFDEQHVKLPGIAAVVHNGQFLGVVAVREEQAIAARDELSRAATWREVPSLPAPENIYAYLRSLPTEQADSKGGDTAPTGAAYLSPPPLPDPIRPMRLLARLARSRSSPTVS